jgi:hypothetical protein
MKAEETEVFFISCFLRGVQAHGLRFRMAGLCPKDAVPANAFMTGWPQEREYVDIPPPSFSRSSLTETLFLWKEMCNHVIVFSILAKSYPL